MSIYARLTLLTNTPTHHNGMGHRLSQTLGATVTAYLLDTQPGLAKVIAATTGPNTDRYLYDPTGIAAQKNNAGNWSYAIKDGLGSVRGQVDNSLAVLGSQGFEPYGTPVDVSGSVSLPHGYTGEPTDPNGMVHLRARYYNPALGAFFNLDPMETANRYGYVGANPINRVDPGGNCWFHPDSSPEQASQCNQAFVSWVEDVYEMYPDWPPAVSSVVNDERGYWGDLSYDTFTQQWNDPNVHDFTGGESSYMETGGSLVIGGAITTQMDSPFPGPADVVGISAILAGTCVVAVALIAEAVTPRRLPLPARRPTWKNKQKDKPDKPAPIPVDPRPKKEKKRKDDDDNKDLRVRHYSYDIDGIKTCMCIGPGTFSIFAEHPIVTPRKSPDLEKMYAIFRPGRALEGIVEFNVDTNKFIVTPDMFLPGASNAVEISLYPNMVGDLSYIDTGFRLTEPRVNPEFYDKSGNTLH